MKFEPRKIRNMGLIGFVILLVLNSYGYFILDQPAAQFFAENWWSTWAPSYLVWLVLSIVGFGRSFKQGNHC